MKTLRLLALLVAAAMFLVACGTNGNGNGNGDDDPVVTTGTLFVNVNVPATVTVLDSDGVQVDQRTNVQATNWDVEAGNYTVQAEAAGYGAQSEPVTITAGQSSTVNFSLVPDTVVLGNVANVEVTRFFDAAGNDYDTNDEINPVKDAILVAAQTEELVGIEIKVTDEDGQAIQGAPVTLSVTGLNLNVAVYSGKPTDIQSSAATFDGVVTDAQGMAYFTLEATYALDSLNDYLEDGLNINEEPAVKVLVSSVGGDNVVKRTEFKAYFVNMSHLWYWGSPYRNQDDDPINLEYAEERLGGVVGPFTNIWTIGETNRHEFNTVALVKQPTSGPFDVGSGEDIFDGRFPGYVRYEIIDVSEDADGDPLIVWENWEDDCNWMNRPAADLDPLVCESGAGSVALVPVDGLGLEDLPISATVKATYVFVSQYGEQVATGTPNQYEFELKDYTFTKTWVGGYLEIDKYVTQHVLTWPGADVTVDAANYSVADEYLSTVVITVSNPSDTDFFNVTVRDALPAELGVIESSISDGGTYDAVNHVITWDFNDTPELQNIAKKSALDAFTFDVYARHKPGYAWEGLNDGNFNVQPNLAAPYADPYGVTNGAAVNSVTAAGFFEDVVTGSQPVFRYVPELDESDIWVVRPVFELSKTLNSSEIMTQGASAFYTLSVQQIDRTEELPDYPASSELYAFLADAYPWEFGDDVIGSGHQAPEYELRTNTYARNVVVSDAWEVGLDFTNGTDFSGVSGGALNTRNAGDLKQLVWSPIADLPMGLKSEAQITLTGNFVSDDEGAPQNGALEELGDGTYAWENCAYLDAFQLNQPADLTGTWYLPENPVAEDWWITAIGDPNNAADLVEAVDGSTYQFGETGQLEDCALVAVIPVPPTPFMNISTNGEALGSDPTDAQNEDVRPGDTFWYRFTAQNTGGAQANDVVITVDRISGGIAFIDADFYFSIDSGVSWTAINPAFTSLDASQIVFSPEDLTEGHWLRVVIEATATSAGEAFVDASLTYSNASTQTPPIGPVQEATNVQP